MIITCVHTVSYSVLINGQPHGKIMPTRGIRQGDPLSTYLFIIYAEGLCNLLLRAESERRILGLPIIKGGTKINHLFFANDSLLFCRANVVEWAHVQAILEMYERASGQQLNQGKTSIFFSKNTKEGTRSFIISLVEVTSTA
jgi:hypothetical protein